MDQDGRRPAAEARIPGSKSLTNRALVLAAAATGTTRLHRPLVSDDATAMAAALGVLGAPVAVDGDTWTVPGLGGGPVVRDARVWCHDAGTAARFLPPLAASGEGDFTFDGSPQLRARPLGPLLDALRELGAGIDPGARGLPFRLRAAGLASRPLTLPSHTSSQYLTGLLLAGPLLPDGLRVASPGLVSRPYVDMTLGLLRRFDGTAVEVEPELFEVAGGGLRGTDLTIEPDASAASYFFAAAALTGTSVTVPGLGTDSLQGDLRFAAVLRQLGAAVQITAESTTVRGTGSLAGGVTVPMGDISDTFMTLAALAPYADGPIKITGIGHTRLKESDRVAAMAANLEACGVPVETGPDWITVRPATPRAAVVRCFADHRIAMSFSVLGLRTPGLELDDPDCVRKTFPGFHAELARLFPNRAEPGISAGGGRPRSPSR